MDTAYAPLIVGLSGTVLSATEAEFLRAVRPLGIILFARNVETGDQVRSLLEAAQAASGAPLTLVDQEGGRVQRARPPLAPRMPSAANIGAAAGALPADAGARLAFLSGRLIAADMLALGFNTPCLPVADVPIAGVHDVIGDRAYSHDPAEVTRLAAAVADGVLAAGALPVMKHMPGHGRTLVDSHLSLPTVTAPRDALERDFAPFKALSHLPLGMSAHLHFTALDEVPATLSATVVGDIIRRHIGFDGLLMTDDISMRALKGSRAEVSQRALAAGIDVVLHCNGRMGEMREIAGAIPAMTEAAAGRLTAALAARRPPDGADVDALRAEFEALLAEAAENAGG